MASVFTHAALPLLAGRALSLPGGLDRRRLGLAAALCACVPDLDWLGVAFDVRPGDLWGHRGLTHSLAFAAALALVVAAVDFRKNFARAAGLLFLAAASHGLLDALTRGDPGVALFAPLDATRYLFPLRPLPVTPLGANEVFGRFGAIVLFNELMWVVAPVGLLAELWRRRTLGLSPRPLARAALAWAAIAALVAALAPSLLAPTQVRVIRGYDTAADDLDWILKDPLPDGRLVTNFQQLAGLFGQRLTPERAPWSSGFFPAWYGSIAGRWRDGRFTLIGRTLTGFKPPSKEEAKEWLARSRAEGLGPTEKYDLARGDDSFAATTRSLRLSHNRSPLPRFWYGVCVGVANAGIAEPEPFRAVDVETADGHTVRFHPIDVKALLAESYYWQAKGGTIGGSCDQEGFDVGAVCSMNPGGLAIGALNYLGRAHRSFVLDVHPTKQSQYYAVAAGKVAVTRAPYPVGDEPFAPGFKDQVAKLVDVDFDFELASTVLSVETGNVPEGPDGTRFQKVGARTIPFHWEATLALDGLGDIVGGRWRGDPANGPDDAAFFGGGPRLVGDGGTALDAHPLLDWPFIQALARASVDDGPGVPTLHADAGSP